MQYHCIIGYGILGKNIFKILSKDNKKIKLFNRIQEKIKKLGKKKVFNNVLEVFKESKIIFFIVKDHKSIDFFFNKIKDKNILKKKIFVNLSTITYKNSIRFSKFAQKLQSKWIEAPTLGSVESLAKKNMFFFYYGQKNKIVIKYLKKIGKIKFCKNIHHPQILKIIHNSICANIMISLGDAFLISKKNKIPNQAIIQMITNSAFFSPLVRNKIKKVKNNYKISFAYNNMLKDLKIFKNSNFIKTNTLSRTYQIYNEHKKMTDKKDSSFIIKKISQI